MKFQFISFFFFGSCFWYYIQSLCQTQGHLDFLLCYIIGVLQQCFTSMSEICFELIFVKSIRSILASSLQACGCLVPAPFIEKMILLPLYYVALLSKYSDNHTCCREGNILRIHYKNKKIKRSKIASLYINYVQNFMFTVFMLQEEI